ncbi:hypothetical protein MPSEU_000926500 [Mayamaea pseudoterrestris]|nr:hypothetical protein MPSEU_000926500 [Mayamaea pseudoterrestris]
MKSILATIALLSSAVIVSPLHQRPQAHSLQQETKSVKTAQILQEYEDLKHQSKPQTHHAYYYNQRFLSSTSSGQSTRSTDAVLFPAFCITLGVLVYYVLSRVSFLTQWLPYTAALFLLGTAMGSISTVKHHSDNILNESIQAWTNIDAAVLLLVFLPGLIYKEVSVGLNVHLFRASIWQTILFAFPLVLAGSVLTALVAYFIFPYGWSFNLCMIMGSVLSATDTVAVAVLMNQLGASPRLKVHVSGESLLNDGSVIVFNAIFVLKFLYELGVEGVGEDIGWARGVALFCRKALGGVAVGLFFGFATLAVLGILNRRFTREENVMEVAASLGLIYAGYFVADYVWAMSGVLATVVQAITIKLYGRAVINDKRLLEDFWTLIESLLNTVLFTLAGITYGSILVENDATFDAREWGYLIVLYLFLMVIRTVIFAVAYPITKRIGLSTNIKETIFQIHAGLRGAVGITLALALNAEVRYLVGTGQIDSIYLDQTRRVFGFIGGISFMTLVINAPTCKPLLIYLNLSESSEIRDKIIQTYHAAFRKQAITEMVNLLAQPRFQHVNFSFIDHHISFLADLSTSELMEAVDRRKASTPPDEYTEPHLSKILPHLAGRVDDAEAAEAPLLVNPRADKVNDQLQTLTESKVVTPELIASPNLIECRALFLDLLRSAYDLQVSEGELVQRLFLTVALERSLDLACDQVANGKPLTDWTYVNAIDPALVKFDRTVKNNPALFKCLECISPGIREKWKQASFRLNIERAMAFMAAHRYAQDFFRRDFDDADPELSEAARLVLEESQTEWHKAEKALNRRDQTFVERSVSHKFCSILLHSSIVYIGKLVDQGLLREQEAEKWVEEVELELDGVNKCHRGHGMRARQCSNMSDMASGRIRQSSSMSDLLTNTSRHGRSTRSVRGDSNASDVLASHSTRTHQSSAMSDLLSTGDNE